METDISSITFTVEAFTYIAKYLPSDNMLDLKCSHNEEYYSWSKIIGDESKQETTSQDMHNQNQTHNVTSTSSCVQIIPNPMLIFKLLEAYKNKTLNDIYTLSFPKDFKTYDTPLVIEIHTKIPYIAEIDKKRIYLSHIPMTEADRVNLKLTRLKETIIEPQRNEIISLKTQMKTLNDSILPLQNSQQFDVKSEMQALENKLNALETKLTTSEGKLLSKLDTEINALDNKYARKTNAEILTASVNSLTTGANNLLNKLNVLETNCNARILALEKWRESDYNVRIMALEKWRDLEQQKPKVGGNPILVAKT